MITYAENEVGVVTSRVFIECFNTNLSLELDKTNYLTTDVANMTVHILNNNNFSMNSRIIIELRDSSSAVKTMVSDVITIENNTWYNYSYYNDFSGVTAGTYTMRLLLLDTGGNPLYDCNNTELMYDYPGVVVTQVSVTGPIGGGGRVGVTARAPSPLYSANCPFDIEINQPMNIEFNITNPSNALFQNILSIELSKDSFRKEAKSIVVTQPNTTSSWYETLGYATCHMPYGIYTAKITWKKVDGEIIRSDELGCFNIPKCEKLQITNFLVDKTVFYVNETSNITAVVKNTGNVNVTDATFNLSVESVMTGQIYIEQFIIKSLSPGQYYTFKLFTNLTQTGPHRTSGIVEKENRIMDKADKSFLVIPKPTQYDILVFFIIFVMILILVTIKVAKRYKEKEEEERMRRVGVLKRVKQKNA